MGGAKIESVEDAEKSVELSVEEIIRMKANDNEIVAIESSDERMPPLSLKAHMQMILLRE